MTLFLLQFKDGVNVDLPSTDKIKVSRDDFQQALLDVKPVSAYTCNVTMHHYTVHITNPQAFGVSNEQLDKYIRNGEYVCFMLLASMRACIMAGTNVQIKSFLWKCYQSFKVLLLILCQ